MVPEPSGILAVGDGACREPGVVGEARDPTGVTGFIRRPDRIAAAGRAGWRESGIAGRTFSRWAWRYALLFCEGVIGNTGVRAGLATRGRAGGEGNLLGVGLGWSSFGEGD